MKPVFLYHGSSKFLDTLKPQQAKDNTEQGSQNAIYACENPDYVITWALPFRYYPDGPGGWRDVEMTGYGKTYVKYGTLDPNGYGYIYKVSSENFEKIDNWQWISRQEVTPQEVTKIWVKDYQHMITFSDEAMRINNELYPPGGGTTMARDYGAEIDMLKKELDFLKKRLDQKIIEPEAETINHSNIINYSGSYQSAGRGSKWEMTVSADKLFSLIESKTATQVLQGIGNSDRLNLLLAILKRPMNVATMVTACGFNTTGQVYHHLKPLIAADLVREDEDEKGVYIVVPHRVQGIIMILAGISDMVNTRYTTGD